MLFQKVLRNDMDNLNKRYNFIQQVYGREIAEKYLAKLYAITSSTNLQDGRNGATQNVVINPPNAVVPMRTNNEELIDSRRAQSNGSTQIEYKVEVRSEFQNEISDINKPIGYEVQVKQKPEYEENNTSSQIEYEVEVKSEFDSEETNIIPPVKQEIQMVADFENEELNVIPLITDQVEVKQFKDDESNYNSSNEYEIEIKSEFDDERPNNITSNEYQVEVKSEFEDEPFYSNSPTEFGVRRDAVCGQSTAPDLTKAQGSNEIVDTNSVFNLRSYFRSICMCSPPLLLDVIVNQGN